MAGSLTDTHEDDRGEPERLVGPIDVVVACERSGARFSDGLPAGSNVGSRTVGRYRDRGPIRAGITSNWVAVCRWSSSL